MPKEVSTVEFAKIYLEQWLEVMKNTGSSKTWNYNSAWTNTHMTILYKLASALEYCNADRETVEKQDYAKTVQQEYYQVDFSLYRYIKNSYWNLDYAIEHENEKYNITKSRVCKGWFDEFAKLLPLKCRKSRVIIGYDYFYTDNSNNSFDAKIQNCINLLNDVDVQQSTAESPILLIIFPNGYKMKQILQGEDGPVVRIVEFICKTGDEKQNWEKIELSNKIIDQNIKDGLISVYSSIKN